MPPLRPECIRAARALLDEPPLIALASGAEVVGAVERASERLVTRLSPWIGIDGCTTLLTRALSRAAVAHPAFAGATIRDASPHFDGLGGLARQSPDDARAAAEEFLGAAFDHLGRLIGDAVAVRLVLPESPDSWGGVPPREGDP